MTRIFEALKKSGVPRAPAPPASPVAPSLHAHTGAASAAVSMPVAARLGIAPRAVEAIPELPEDVVREMTALRMTLESALVGRSPRTVMLVSAQRGEGTSTVAAQFASVLARDGRQRVLLMDLNARRPSPFVEGPDGSGSDIQRIPSAGGETTLLDVLPVPEVARTAGLIAAPAAREWLEAVSSGYDWIVLDGPPVLEAPDAPSLAAIADGVVVVIEAGRTKRPVLHRATDLLRKARAQLVGSVLNRRRLEIPEFLYRRI